MKLFKQLLMLLCLGIVTLIPVQAKDGMYLLSDIPEMMPQLIEAGCACSGQQIYSADGTSLANQVPHFGRGCSSEIISANGLLLTNYHCAHGSIQSVSSVEHDYLKNGFWATRFEEELPVEGLSVRVPVKVVDVTTEVLAKLGSLSGEEKENKLNQIVSQMIQFEKSKADDVAASVREMLGGTKYVLFVSRIFRDVRLVGAPPMSLGKFGGDRDNWMWPRHTADFTYLRIYGDKDGKPADYSETNEPLNTPYHIEVSTEGVSADDFVFILGYPGGTDMYSTSFEVEERQNITNKIRYAVRTEKLRVMEEQMKKNDTIRIKYSSKQAGVSNYWKHANSQNIAFDKIDIMGQKRKAEATFIEWVNESPERQAEYKDVFKNIQEALDARKDNVRELILQREALYGMELVGFLSRLDNKYFFNAKNDDEIVERAKRFYKNMDIETETKIMAALLKEYFETTNEDYFNDVKETIQDKFNGNYELYAQSLVQSSVFKTYEGYKKVVVDMKDKATLENDDLYQFANSVANSYSELRKEIKEPTSKFSENQELYKKGIAESATEILAPDANSTIRLTYGHVKDLVIDEETTYPYFTTLEGVMKKYNSDKEFYELPDDFVKLYENKDFGRYASNGTVPVCFIATTHTTGGNSGSPVFDAKGRLVGLLFDGNSEGLSGDYQFDEGLVRSIIVDVRYVLYITEKLGKSSHIIDELGLGDEPVQTEE
ncbi:dipeptidyl-peptidase 7 [Balneicella halophila]|uniref:Dipeptidyl-peptidase 7 n=1 Tax=Balneicella halophila TaxID=1537566 RepID=A0A7L4UPG8_BALHA|nr:S46 family peptidase [Balneicella halophila]PVX50706.1 dipeptidyl-peptidase 7 [Balneicella halophila]